MVKDLEEKLGTQDQGEGPVMITQGLGEDTKSGDSDEEGQEESV